MDNIIHFPYRSKSPEIMMTNIVREHQNNLEEIVLVVKTLDGNLHTYATTSNKGFLSIASVMMNDLAKLSVTSKIKDE